MSLERYKTQVLLLHSQQSTLDVLSAGFNDRYSVHCATSGTEALNTLGDTPIHVFVSAQDLPGMSGLDAIREAKKRSPETIGILLAGTDMQDGLEALVGIQEVFQIVRGKIEPVALLELIETATKSVRLLALSESANDHRANVDEPISEHIVMETSENGSTIISDGTGTLPVLRPSKVDLAPGVGGRDVDVLVLTKDEEFLATIKDSARGLHNVYHAVTPTQAETFVRDHKVGVLVTDAAMVGSNIEGLTQRLRAKRGRIVAIVAGRRDDGDLLMDLINRGHVYRFLLKPVSPGRARLAIEASVKHHMEAPDEAFTPKNQPSQIAPKPTPVAKPATVPKVSEKPKEKPAAAQPAKTAPKREPRPAPKLSEKPKPVATTGQKIEPTISSMSSAVTLDAGLDAAFGETNSFTDTMTGIVTSFGKSVSGAKESVVGGAKDVLHSVGSTDAFKNTKFIAIGGGVLAVAVVAWLVLSGGESSEDASGGQQTSNTTAVRDLPPSNNSDKVVEAQAERPIQPGDVNIATAPPRFAARLEEARAARDAGNLIAPPGKNALELFSATVAQADGDAIVAAEFNAVVGQVLGMAENAILARNAVDAESALTMARNADPQNPRLAFLRAQLSELKVRDTADRARVAIREDRFDDATALISEARSVAGANSVEVNLLTAELQSARTGKQVSETIAIANQRLEAGTLIAPANDNARYFFQQALINDPENQAAHQGLITIASKLVLQARDAIDNGRLDSADTLLGEARSLDPASSELRAATTALAGAREAVAEAARQAEKNRLAELQRQQEAARQAEAERVATAQRAQEAAQKAEADRVAEAKRQQEAARQAEADRQAEIDRQAEAQRLADARRAEQAKQDELDRIAAVKQQAIDAEVARIAAEKQANQAATASPLGVGAAAPVTAAPVAQKPQPESPTRNAVTTFSLPAQDTSRVDTLPAASARPESQQGQIQQQPVQEQPVAQQQQPVLQSRVQGEPELVPVSQLTRTNYVGPEYPRAARRRNQTGAVEVQFTVTTDGRVRNMSVLRSEPGDTFDQAAMDAVEQWRFEPVIENGMAVEKRTAVRLAFDLQ